MARRSRGKDAFIGIIAIIGFLAFLAEELLKFIAENIIPILILVLVIAAWYIISNQITAQAKKK